jgi:hypothetical protein
MKILLTIYLGIEDIDPKYLNGYKTFHFGNVYNKYNISISNINEYEKRLEYLAFEISKIKSNIVIVDNPCYNLNDIQNLIKELKIKNNYLSGIFLPSKERLVLRKIAAYSEHEKWNRLLGTSNQEIERNFDEHNQILKEIIAFARENNIDVIVV